MDRMDAQREAWPLPSGGIFSQMILRFSAGCVWQLGIGIPSRLLLHCPDDLHRWPIMDSSLTSRVVLVADFDPEFVPHPTQIESRFSPAHRVHPVVRENPIVEPRGCELAPVFRNLVHEILHDLEPRRSLPDAGHLRLLVYPIPEHRLDARRYNPTVPHIEKHFPFLPVGFVHPSTVR